jgi:hypothetical protein
MSVPSCPKAVPKPPTPQPAPLCPCPWHDLLAPEVLAMGLCQWRKAKLSAVTSSPDPDRRPHSDPVIVRITTRPSWTLVLIPASAKPTRDGAPISPRGPRKSPGHSRCPQVGGVCIVHWSRLDVGPATPSVSPVSGTLATQ